jgi:hypothetical protein
MKTYLPIPRHRVKSHKQDVLFEDSSGVLFATNNSHVRITNNKSRLSHVVSGCITLVVFILVATATAKLVSLWKLGGPFSGSLVEKNLVFPFFSEGVVLILASTGEYGLAVLLGFWKNIIGMLWTLAWFVTICILYRYVFYVISTGGYCGWIGVWPNGFQPIADTGGTVSLAILTLIGWGGLAISLVCLSASSRSPHLKF